MQLCLQVRVLAAVQVHAGVQYTAYIYVLHINVLRVLPVFVWTNDVEVFYQGSVDNYNHATIYTYVIPSWILSFELFYGIF